MKMTITLEKINELTSVHELLGCTKQIRKESFDYAFANHMVMDKTLKSYRQLETIAYERAVEIATTPEELETCAVSIEDESLEYPDPDGWADEIRIKAYGIEWYLKREFSSPAYQGFIDFTNEEGLENPFEELARVIYIITSLNDDVKDEEVYSFYQNYLGSLKCNSTNNEFWEVPHAR